MSCGPRQVSPRLLWAVEMRLLGNVQTQPSPQAAEPGGAAGPPQSLQLSSSPQAVQEVPKKQRQSDRDRSRTTEKKGEPSGRCKMAEDVPTSYVFYT